jgi:hypothetical protein
MGKEKCAQRIRGTLALMGGGVFSVFDERGEGREMGKRLPWCERGVVKREGGRDVSYNYDYWLLCPEIEERNRGEGKEMQGPWCTQTIVFMRTQGWHAAQRRECKTEKGQLKCME